MKIFAIGMNYAAHNEELHGTLLKPEEPVIFIKADSALLKPGRPFFVPDHLGRIDYEAEVVVRISRLGKNVSPRFAHRYYDALTVGIDFTARDLQRRASHAGQPWTISKGFDGAAAIGEWTGKELLLSDDGGEGQLRQLHFRLDISSADDRRQGRSPHTVQEGCTGDMFYSIDETISYISRFFTLKTGDLLYTGTPAGVGPVRPGDNLTGYLEGRQVLDLHCR